MSLQQSQSLPIGWQAADFKLLDCHGADKTLADFGEKQGLLIIFTCNHCPYAKAAWPVLIKLYGPYHNQISFVAINPNDSVKFPADSFEAMKALKLKLGIPFPYLRDKPQKAARAYNAQCTPDVFLFKTENNVNKLFYHGRINDNWQQPAQVKENNLEDAIKLLLDNQEPPVNQPVSMGCTIKWL